MVILNKNRKSVELNIKHIADFGLDEFLISKADNAQFLAHIMDIFSQLSSKTPDTAQLYHYIKNVEKYLTDMVTPLYSELNIKDKKNKSLGLLVAEYMPYTLLESKNKPYTTLALRLVSQSFHMSRSVIYRQNKILPIFFDYHLINQCIDRSGNYFTTPEKLINELKKAVSSSFPLLDHMYDIAYSVDSYPTAIPFGPGMLLGTISTMRENYDIIGGEITSFCRAKNRQFPFPDTFIDTNNCHLLPNNKMEAKYCRSGLGISEFIEIPLTFFKTYIGPTEMKRMGWKQIHIKENINKIFTDGKVTLEKAFIKQMFDMDGYFPYKRRLIDGELERIIASYRSLVEADLYLETIVKYGMKHTLIAKS